METTTRTVDLTEIQEEIAAKIDGMLVSALKYSCAAYRVRIDTPELSEDERDDLSLALTRQFHGHAHVFSIGVRYLKYDHAKGGYVNVSVTLRSSLAIGRPFRPRS